MSLSTADALRMHAELRALSESRRPLPTRLAYAVGRNLRALTPVADAYAAALATDDDAALAAFERARFELLRAHAIRAADGGMQVRPDGSVALADPGAFQAAVEALAAQHPRAEDARRARAARAAELDGEDAGVTLHRVPFELLPDTIEAAALDALLPMLDGCPG